MTLAMRNIRKSFGSNEVVKGLNLEVAEGEFLVLLGPSGCGKTTALRMIAGLEAVTSGDILIGGEDVTGVLPKYRNVAMVFQSYALYPHMTVAENIGYPLKVGKVPRDEMARAVRETARKVHLEDLLDRFPRQLSGGQRQRVALARAMVRRPRLFLMDEPLSNLDAKLRGYMRSELKHLQAELGVTTVYVTHDQIEAMTLADRVAVMEAGIVQQLDTPRRIYDDPANLFVAGFVGSPPMNFVSGEIKGGAFECGGAGLPCPGLADNPLAVMGVRPEDIRVTGAGEGWLQGAIYSLELTGDETIVTVAAAETHLISRMDKDFDMAMGAEVGVEILGERSYFFDAESGERLRAENAAGR